MVIKEQPRVAVIGAGESFLNAMCINPEHVDDGLHQPYRVLKAATRFVRAVHAQDASRRWLRCHPI